jgi:uncharacterized protein YbjT (DUF2867 family)
MSKEIAIIGGTGTVGGHVAQILRERGHPVRVLSRSSAEHPVDVSTGAGLDAALAGCGVVVDAANATKQAEQVLVAGSRRVAAAAAQAGVGHLVGVSIVGIEQVPMAYYRAKLDQEAVWREGMVGWSIVRSTQFHELVDGALSAMARLRISPRAAARLQPIGSVEVAQVLADAALAGPTGAVTTVAGPEISTLSELARQWAQARRRRGLPLALPLVTAAGRALRRGALTCSAPDHRGTQTFAAWLT